MKRDLGQATVEFVIVLPLIVMLVSGVLYLMLVVRAELRVHEAAREGARGASLDPDPGAGERAAHRVAPGAAVFATRGGVGDPVTVTVSLSVTDHLPVMSALVSAPTVHATAVMRAER